MIDLLNSRRYDLAAQSIDVKDMTFEFIQFLAIGVLSFCVVFAMPGWYTLITAAVFGVLGCSYVLLGQITCKRNCGDTALITAIVLAGVLVGVTARATNLGLVGSRSRWTATLLATLAPLSIPAMSVIIGNQKQHDADLRALPLGDACGTTLIPVKVGSVDFRTQPIPITYLRQVLQPSELIIYYYFHNAEQTRTLCTRFAKPGPALEIDYIYLQPHKVWEEPFRDNAAMWNGVCSKPVHTHVAELCSVRTDFTRLDALDWPGALQIFGPERTTEVKRPPFRPTTHPIAMAAIEKAGQTGATVALKTDASGTFDVNTIGARAYWIARDGVWTTPDGKPFSLSCSAEANTQGLVQCQAGYPWRNDVHLHYIFRAPADAVAAKARKVEAKVAAILGELVVP